MYLGGPSYFKSLQYFYFHPPGCSTYYLLEENEPVEPKLMTEDCVELRESIDPLGPGPARG